jgi:hypothetical protein
MDLIISHPKQPSYVTDEQPDEVVTHMLLWCDFSNMVAPHMLLWCDFSDMVALRCTNRQLKRLADKVLEERALQDPLVSEGVGYFSTNDLQLRWTWSDREVLIETAIRFDNETHQHNEDPDIIRQMLQSQGVFDLMEFWGTPEEVVRWGGVLIDFDQSISVERAWENARSMLLALEVVTTFRRRHALRSLRQCLFSLLVVARPSSIHYVTWDYEDPYRPASHWSGHEERGLMFLTSDNRKFALNTRWSL